MRVLVIDNGSHHIKELIKSLDGYKVRRVKFGNIDFSEAKEYDKIVLSGGSLAVLEYKKEFSKEIDLIKISKVPILGICLGFELIAETFGEKLERMDSKEKGILNVRKIRDNDILSRLENFKVYEAHRWNVKKCKKMISLAVSEKGVEVIKHPKREIYGVQFHPEMFHRKTEGINVLRNFLEL